VDRPSRAAPAAADRSPPGGHGVALPCPRCREGTLVTGKRGWGCSRWREGCPFVIWFETAGKRLTASQLEELVKKGKTRKAKFGQPPVPGRLVLDLEAGKEAGSARLVED
jgi:DNA topoisomerase-3